MEGPEDLPDCLLSGLPSISSLPLYDSQSLEAEIADVLAWPDRSHEEVRSSPANGSNRRTAPSGSCGVAQSSKGTVAAK